MRDLTGKALSWPRPFLKNDISRYWIALDATLAATKYFNMKLSIFFQFKPNQELLLTTATAHYSSVLVKLHPSLGVIPQTARTRRSPTTSKHLSLKDITPPDCVFFEAGRVFAVPNTAV